VSIIRLSRRSGADGAALIILTVATGSEAAVLAVSFEPEPHG
jgi:hypothetical protein